MAVFSCIFITLLCSGVGQAFISSTRWSSLAKGIDGVHHKQRSSLNMAYKKVFVAGGSKGVGRAIVDKLVEQGSEVVALVRREDAKNELESIAGVRAVLCDALDLKGVENALDGCDAAITTLGGAPDGDEQKRVDYVGNRNVIESAGILGITRVLMVTSIGCGDSREAISDQVYQVLENALKAKTLAENMLHKYYTNSEWTVVRPGGLRTHPATGKALFTEDTRVSGMIHREDVADLAVHALNSPRTFRKTLTAVDPSLNESPRESIAAFEL